MEILYFYGEGCPQCKDADEYVEKVRETGTQVIPFEIWSNKENLALAEEIDKGECGGVPFFHNKTTGESLCGVPDFETFQKFVEGK